MVQGVHQGNGVAKILKYKVLEACFDKGGKNIDTWTLYQSPMWFLNHQIGFIQEHNCYILFN